MEFNSGFKGLTMDNHAQ